MHVKDTTVTLGIVMKHFIRLALVCALAGSAFFFYQRSKNHTVSPLGETIRIGISADNPPFTFVKDGKFVGFELDLARAIAAKIAYNLEVLDLDFSGLIPAINNDVVDAALADFGITDERKKNIDFSEPYYSTKNNIVILGHQTYMSSSEFPDARIGYQHGSVFEGAAKKLQAKLPGITAVGFHRVNQAIQELQQKSIDMILIDTAVAQQITQSHAALLISNLELDDDSNGVGVIFKKGSPLVAKFNEALKTLKADGTLEALTQKWLTSTEQSAPQTKE
jgi:polar amino acid transport system substrate-binding protein